MYCWIFAKCIEWPRFLVHPCSLYSSLLKQCTHNNYKTLRERKLPPLWPGHRFECCRKLYFMPKLLPMDYQIWIAKFGGDISNHGRVITIWGSSVRVFWLWTLISTSRKFTLSYCCGADHLRQISWISWLFTRFSWFHIICVYFHKQCKKQPINEPTNSRDYNTIWQM